MKTIAYADFPLLNIMIWPGLHEIFIGFASALHSSHYLVGQKNFGLDPIHKTWVRLIEFCTVIYWSYIVANNCRIFYFKVRKQLWCWWRMNLMVGRKMRIAVLERNHMVLNKLAHVTFWNIRKCIFTNLCYIKIFIFFAKNVYFHYQILFILINI